MSATISHYKVTWSVASRTADIELVTEKGQAKIENLSAVEAHFLVDILRNERPVVWDETTNTMHTMSELVGEGELR